MKSLNPSLTLNNSPAHRALECIANANSFLLETLDQNTAHKIIYASEPEAIFSSFEELENFLANNPEILQKKDAGFSGFVGYDGQTRLALYQKIEINEVARTFIEKEPEIDFEFQIEEPNYKRLKAAILHCQREIKEGNIYQANLCEKFLVNYNKNLLNKHPEELKILIYNKLTKANPAEYSGIIDLDNKIIFSSSPESFIKFERLNQEIKLTSSPIKGTARLDLLEELILSEKEKAEHIMIVDLIRNDLGQLCKAGSVVVESLMQIKSLNNLHHLVSSVSGLLENNCIMKNKIPQFSKIFSAISPGGSITGAPKLAAINLIKQLESFDRGLFTGSMGYYKFNQGGEFSILIRSIFFDKLSGELYFAAGSGITSDSDPDKEIDEIIIKCQKIREALN